MISAELASAQRSAHSVLPARRAPGEDVKHAGPARPVRSRCGAEPRRDEHRPVAPALLGRVEGPVGRGEQLGRPSSASAGSSATPALAVTAMAMPVPEPDGLVAPPRRSPAGPPRGRTRPVGLDEDEGKLLAADPRRPVDGADRRRAMRRAASRRTASPAGWPWESLIDLKRSRSMIAKRQRLPEPQGPVLLLGKDPVVFAAVEEPGQLVAGGKPAQGLERFAQLERVPERALERARR